jgi:hypothetical protein
MVLTNVVYNRQGGLETRPYGRRGRIAGFPEYGHNPAVASLQLLLR